MHAAPRLAALRLHGVAPEQQRRLSDAWLSSCSARGATAHVRQVEAEVLLLADRPWCVALGQPGATRVLVGRPRHPQGSQSSCATRQVGHGRLLEAAAASPR